MLNLPSPDSSPMFALSFSLLMVVASTWWVLQ